MKALILISLVWSSLASGEIVRQVAGRGYKDFAILAGDGGKFSLLVTREAAGRLPVVIRRLPFTDEERARDTFNKLTRGWIDVSSAPTNEAVITEAEGASLWPVTRKWSVEWERRYERWIAEEFDEGFFKSDVKTDCADVIYAVRWIFARLNGLPAANRLGGSGIMFTNFSMKEEWQDLPTHKEWRKDRRFLAALDYLLELTYTGALVRDSYPIQINREWLAPGAHLTYSQGESGHNNLITKVTDGTKGELPIRMMYSTVPRDYRYLAATAFAEPKQPHAGGFLRMRWPELTTNGKWSLVAAEKMPGYSTEQYSPEFTEFKTFDEAVFQRVAPSRIPDFKLKVQSQLLGLLNAFEQRIILVNDGHAKCFPDRCPQGGRDYEDHSTPSRDKRILEHIHNVKRVVEEHPEAKWTYKSVIWNNSITIDYEHWQSVTLTLDNLIETWEKGRFSSDPNRPIRERWGF